MTARRMRRRDDEGLVDMFTGTSQRMSGSHDESGAHGQAAYYRQVAQYDHDFTGHLETHYPRIKAPTQILWGAEDRWIAPDTAPRLQALIPGARLSYLPDAGHFAMLDTPNLVAEKIEAFLASL